MADFHVNPFSTTLLIRYNEVITRIDSTSSIEVIRESYEYELDKGMKVYYNPSIREFLYTKLTSFARDLYLAMIYSTNPGYTYVIITYEKIRELFGGTYSKRRYNDTIKELIGQSILAPKDRVKGQYWYNPRFYCSGKRLDMYPECKVKVATKYKLSGQSWSDVMKEEE